MTKLFAILFVFPVINGMQKDIPIIIYNKNNKKAFYKVDEASNYNLINHKNPENGFLYPDNFCEIQRPFPCYRTINIDTANEKESHGHYEVTMIPVKPYEYLVELRDKTLTNQIPIKIDLVDTLEITCQDNLAITIDEYGHVQLPKKDY